MVGEGVGPEENLAARRPRVRRPPREPRPKRLGRERAACGARWAIPASAFATAARPGIWVTAFASPGATRRQPRPAVDRAHRIRGAGPQPALRSSARGTPPCRSPCPRRPGSRSCTPCTRGRGRAPRAPPRPSTRVTVSPRSISNRSRARPRVECFSSRVDHVARAHRPALAAAALSDADAAHRAHARIAAVLRETRNAVRGCERR